MIRLLAEGRELALSEQQVSRVKFWLCEVLSTARCRVTAGPGVGIVVLDREPDDLTPWLQRHVEEVIGCELAPDPGSF
ncbi:hypothetical protein [Kutzneria sp. CA-103260]|uniref:hypothetical protein n=1 Tax=Kutzneria sp. CA-103260 TaxID=2802641 RepID=UPI001BA63B38|nr:hypothetical protein [Kutzneria sp. CA-103260]